MRVAENPPSCCKWQREVLLGQIVLEYNSDVWFDVHPLVREPPTYKASESRATGNG